jgi:hypothetical protein
MRNVPKYRWCALACGLALAACLFVGCEDDDDEPVADVAGVWRVTGTPAGTLRMELAQSGDNVTGSYDYRGAWWSFTGEVDGDRLNGRVIPSNAQPSVTVTATLAGEELRGSWGQGTNGGSFAAVRL